MKNTLVINKIWYEVTAPGTNVVTSVNNRLGAYREADHLKDLGFDGITIKKITLNEETEEIEGNY